MFSFDEVQSFHFLKKSRTKTVQFLLRSFERSELQAHIPFDEFRKMRTTTLRYFRLKLV